MISKATAYNVNHCNFIYIILHFCVNHIIEDLILCRRYCIFWCIALLNHVVK